VRGSLKIDIEDIVYDLSTGMALCDREAYEEAIWSWRFSYYRHWGGHLTRAQTAIWQYLSRKG
ncbi:MAG TPA: DUF5063 domain-containing protein, partial [Candidatus Tumulicola sp.]